MTNISSLKVCDLNLNCATNKSGNQQLLQQYNKPIINDISMSLIIKNGVTSFWPEGASGGWVGFS